MLNGGGAGTIGRADLGLGVSGLGSAFSPLSVQNQNGDSVAPITQTASGGAMAGGGGPALTLTGLVAAIVIWRLLLHQAAR